MSDNAALSLREVQLSCLGVLKAFDVFCRENALSYFLSGGTLLGAVRHRGFIPWDDDVDVMMPRRDYQRLLELSDRLDGRLHSLSDATAYARPWARMTDEGTRRSDARLFAGDTQAAYIDIFPIDGVPDGARASRLFYLRLRLLDALWRAGLRNYVAEGERLPAVKKLLSLIARPLGARRFSAAMNRLAARVPYDGAHRGVSMITHYGAREKMPAEVFEGAVELDFEGLKLPAPAGYATYLTRLYGDYMQIPPEHRRVSGHSAGYEKKEAAHE